MEQGQSDYRANTEDYPEELILEAMKKGMSHLAGMFDNNVGGNPELRSGTSTGSRFSNSEPACATHTSYIRPRMARNTRGSRG